MAEVAPIVNTALRQRAEQLAHSLPPLMVEAERVASTVAQGVHGRRRVGTGETFWQFRRYHSGDAAQRIDWRQSAKSEKLFVRENEWEAAQSVWLWRDGSASMRYGSRFSPVSKLERASLLTLALAALLLRGGERVTLLGSGARPSTGRAALSRMAELLDVSERAEMAASQPPNEQLPRFSQVVLMGDFLSPLAEIERSVMSFASAGIRGHLLQILDPAEEDLPFHGRMRFEGLEAEGELTVGRVEELRAGYRQRMLARAEALTDRARGIGWSFSRHRTDRSPQTALLALYSAISGELTRNAW
jgi:uncharacterized protein (DUF58 family)